VLPLNATAAVDAAFAAHPGQISCIILEPYPANVGLILPDDGFLAHLRASCSANGALLIFDEVMTGFRLSRAGVQGLVDVKPDLTTLGKIIGGGLPVGAFGGRREIMEKLAPLGPVYQAGTLSGNPLAMAAGIAALKLLDELDPYARLARMGESVRDVLASAAAAKGIPAQVPQVGSMFSIFFTATPVRDLDTAMTGDAKLFGRFFHACLERGVYLPPSAYETCFISTAHEGHDIERACEIMVEALHTL
jgi:glutamate-1-semialdehyde 2,1-aminomutase